MTNLECLRERLFLISVHSTDEQASSSARLAMRDLDACFVAGEIARTKGEIPARVRAVVLARDGGLCVYCLSPATTIDHVLPRSRGGSHAPRNLAACCLSCNLKKRARTPDEAGMVKRRSIRDLVFA